MKSGDKDSGRGFKDGLGKSENNRIFLTSPEVRSVIRDRSLYLTFFSSFFPRPSASFQLSLVIKYEAAAGVTVHS